MRMVIFNADDFGLDADTFATTVSCIEAGLVQSATIMTGMPASHDAYRIAKDYASHLSFGLHFNIVDRHLPLSRPCRSLCDTQQVVLASDRQRMRALLHRVDAREVAREFELQITELLDHGVRISHVDSHGHLHKFPAVINAIRPSLARFGIRRVRRPQDLFFRKQLRRRLLNDVFTHAFRGLDHPHHFLAIDTSVPDWVRHLPTLIPEGITEISVHPGHTEAWRRSEAQPLLDTKELAAVLRDNGIALVNYYY
jgi:predicted glycoside hydrolase/deacetylase ChbG (UPF0249 family)